VAAGAADAVSRFPYEMADWATRQKEMRLVSVRGPGVTMLGFSAHRGSPFADLRVRRAVALAIDRAKLLPPGERRDSVPIEQLVPAGVFGHLPSRAATHPDPEGAARLLAEARFRPRAALRLAFSDTHADVGRALVGQLAALGIQVVPETVPQAELYARFASNPPDLFLMSWAAGTGDGSDVLEALFHSPVGGLGTANRFGYANPELDALVAAAARSLDPAARREALWAAFRLLARDVPAVPLLARSSLYAVRADLEWTPRRHRRMRAADLHPAPR
jgi:peptide/nickel transport system substrate-binding protein